MSLRLPFIYYSSHQVLNIHSVVYDFDVSPSVMDHILTLYSLLLTQPHCDTSGGDDPFEKIKLKTRSKCLNQLRCKC